MGRNKDVHAFGQRRGDGNLMFCERKVMCMSGRFPPCIHDWLRKTWAVVVMSKRESVFLAHAQKGPVIARKEGEGQRIPPEAICCTLQYDGRFDRKEIDGENVYYGESFLEKGKSICNLKVLEFLVYSVFVP